MENTVITIPDDSPEAPVRYQGEEYRNYLSGRSRRAVLETGEDRESCDTLTRSGGTSCLRRRPAVDKDKGISISAADPCGARRAEVYNLNQLNGHGHAHVAASQDINSSNKGKEKAEDCGSVSNRETIDLSTDRQQNRGTKRRLVRQAADVHETAGVVERDTRQQRRRRNGFTTTSSRASNEPQVSSPGEPFNNSRPPRIQNHQRRNNTQQVLEIQDSSPQVRAFRGSTHIQNGVSDVNVRQIEADEVLARELQEQLYQEERLIRHEQMDLNLARLLELVENSLPASSSPSRLELVENSLRASSTRNTPNSSTIAANPGGRSCLEARLQQHSSRRRLNPPQARPPVRSPPRGRGHRLGLAPDLLDRAMSLGLAPDLLDRAINLSFPDDSSFYARLDFLEGIENAIEHTINSRNLLHMDRDFNEALDENNHHRHGGASTQRINDLPESTVQTDKFEETCVICLETPTIGETIRHLLCLHKFHKDCIDPWLGRSKACPLCKSSVT
ncbi:PREDICTED: uncharacterized protein LOC104747432 isoform X2 [Camelina sativa]|uniref:Uncharacterized protein LOC104747432 isoform X2 n=1 Tax=Camelina sativa TaxID=90675 RepID=A0ABM0W8U2_CAMSA|nr:PREDICTED: uncharacterized protein LOC104747432 isoform X2 [Camelina sativa]